MIVPKSLDKMNQDELSELLQMYEGKAFVGPFAALMAFREEQDMELLFRTKDEREGDQIRGRITERRLLMHMHDQILERVKEESKKQDSKPDLSII